MHNPATSSMPHDPAPAVEGVVRKRLDDDCLLGNELHPSIAERLDRIREMPVSSVANLHPLERDSAGLWLVWQYIPGQTLEQYLSEQHPESEVARLLQQVKLVVAAMHSHGIVHGAIHERNIIIDPQGKVRLTHVSPLLFSDPVADEQAVLRLASLMGCKTQPTRPTDQVASEQERRFRRWAYAMAFAAAIAGVAMFLTVLWYIRS